MTQDEIIRSPIGREKLVALAREAGYQSVYLSDAPIGRSYQFLERFAALVAAHEREACAKVCEELKQFYEHTVATQQCAAAIRSRSNEH